MKKQKYTIKDESIFKSKIINYIKRYDCFCFLDSNSSGGDFDYLCAFSTKEALNYSKNLFKNLKKFDSDNYNDWIFGYFSYDVKNIIEPLKSNNLDCLRFPKSHFFIPQIVCLVKDNVLTVFFDKVYTSLKIERIISTIKSTPLVKSEIYNVKLKSRLSKQEYINRINTIKDEIKQGNIYEMNFCQEFYSESVKIDPFSLFQKLNKLSKSPFASFYKVNDNFCICASPERFLKKTNNKIISQPIKGTIERSDNTNVDELNKIKLQNSQKEFSENIMIVDLVRNDMSQFASKKSVFVEELMGLYSYTDVHHLVSTISCELHPNFDWVDSIRFSFPMGSMTGAPKFMAMKLIDKYEKTLRGIYSGSIGYVKPNRDFDFNVVIRSILYNKKKQYLSFMVGGAITAESDPESEYNECIFKSKSLLKTLNV